ncbi:MAG: hypothetical protein AB8G96_06745 [Phycisphaerales bacterium]
MTDSAQRRTPTTTPTVDGGHDALIDRIASGDLTGATWSRWANAAGDDSAAWRSMAECLRDQLALIDLAQVGAGAANAAGLPAVTAAQAADTFDAASLEALLAPTADATDAITAGPLASPAAMPNVRAVAHDAASEPAMRFPAPRSTGARARGAAGWLVAAMLLLSLIVSAPLRSGTAPSVGPVAGDPSATPTPTEAVQTAGLTADDALSLYLDRGRAEGRVVRESPTQVLISSRPSADGKGLEVTYVRQILERMVVPEMYTNAGRNEDGGVRLARLEARRPQPPM